LAEINDSRARKTIVLKLCSVSHYAGNAKTSTLLQRHAFREFIDLGV
jgi:hypothetical protein